VSGLEVNDVKEDPSGYNKKFTFSLTNTSSKDAFLSDLSLSCQLTTDDGVVSSESPFFGRSSIVHLSEDEEVKNTEVMPPNTTTQFSILFNSEHNGTQYKDLKVSLTLTNQN